MAITADINILSQDSVFLNTWKDEIRKSMRQIYADLDEELLEEIIEEDIRENLQLPAVTLDNNYTGEVRKTNLLSVIDWVMKRKPLIAGNGTFYKNQHEAMNPIAVMLQEFLSKRKSLKKEMFKIADVSSDLYKDLDRSQLNEKISANSYYGASGMNRSAFYSQWSGPATTGTAQSIISTTETFFEGFMVNNYKFISINECIHFMNAIIETDYVVDSWISKVSKEELFEHIVNSFYDDVYEDSYEQLLMNYIYNLSSDNRAKIFYKFNLLEFIKRHDKIIKLFRQIFKDVKNHNYVENLIDVPTSFYADFTDKSEKNILRKYEDYINKEFFMDPNSPPKSIIKPLTEMNSLLMTYVHMPLMMFDRIHRLKYFNRKVVCIVDTDSNILTLDAWTAFCRKYILDSDYNRSEENNKFIMVNTVAYFLTNGVQDVLHQYAMQSNIPEDHRHYFTMKNEFYFNKLIVGKKKKRYISSIKLREGTYLKKYKADVKGFDFRKATTSDLAKARFDKIVEKRIFEHESVDIPGILADLESFENDIRQSLLSGDKIYLPLGNAKNLDAYKDPYSQQGVRGAVAWNFIHPDRQISLPSKVSLLKLNIFTIDDIYELEQDYPNEYKIIRDKIFGSKINAIASKGLQVLAIPNGEEIPEWCKKYIDYSTVINNIISQFKGVTDSFGIEFPEVGKQIKTVNRKTNKFSNIVRF